MLKDIRPQSEKYQAHGWPLRNHLLIFGLTLYVPVIILSAILAHFYVAEIRARTISYGADVTDEALVVLEHEIANAIGTLETLASDPALQSGDWSGFHERARRAVSKRGIAVILRDSDGRQIINTRVACCGALPAGRLVQTDWPRLSKLTPQVSNLYVGGISGQLVFSISAPVIDNAVFVHSLSLAISADEIGRLFQRHPPSDGWHLIVTDRIGRIVVASPQPDEHIGQITADMTAHESVEPRGIVLDSHNLDGKPIVRAFHRSAQSNWVVMAWKPMAEIEERLNWSKWLLTGGSLVLLVSALGLAAVFNQGLAQPIKALADQSTSVLADPEATTLPLRSRVREVSAVSLALIDAATKLSASTAALRISETRLRLALEAGRMGTFTWDFAGRRSHWDAMQHAIFGTDPKALGPKPEAFMELVHPDDQTRLAQAVLDARATGRSISCEFRIKQADGSWRWVLVRGSAEMDAQGQPLLMRGVSFDVTERKDAEAALARDRAQLEQLVSDRTADLRAEMQRREAIQEALAQARQMESLGMITGSVAHDFGNLLQVIIGSLEAYLRTGVHPPDQAHVLNAYDAAKTACAITGKLVTFASQQSLNSVVTDLNVTLGQVRDQIATLMGPSISLVYDLKTGLWPARIDVPEIKNAIINLSMNARAAMPSGGILTIQTGNIAPDDSAVAWPIDLQPGHYVAVSVSDTGEGMAAQVAARAFEPFFTTKLKGAGAGLGLSTIYGFVKQSGGHVDLRSAPGAGTTVTLYFPRTE